MLESGPSGCVPSGYENGMTPEKNTKSSAFSGPFAMSLSFVLRLASTSGFEVSRQLSIAHYKFSSVSFLILKFSWKYTYSPRLFFYAN